ncbi:MAG: PAS domain S-box protein [Deltaproteobacteria bacterium]|nr:PAS domain S-box protein [Deltaproteobacteria bacterium]
MKKNNDTGLTGSGQMLREESLFSIFEKAPFGIFIVGEDGRIEYANESMCELLGVSREKLVDLNVYELLSVKDIGLDSMIKMAFCGKKFVVGPVLYTGYFEKKRRYRKFTGIPIRSKESKKVLVFVEDVTDLKAKEEELAKEKETFFSVFENLPVGIIVTDEKGKVRYINKEFTDITGYTKDDVPDGKTFFRKAYPDPDFRHMVIDIWKRAKKEKVKDSFQFRVTCKDGSEKEIEFRSEYLDDGRIVTALSDITALKMMERELLESERRFRSIFESSRDAIYITSFNGNFIDVNQAFCEMFGEKKEDVLKKSAKEAYISEEDKVKLKTAIKKAGFVKDFEIKLKKANGEIIDCLLTVTGVKDLTGRIVQYHGIVRDITEKKRAEEKIRYMAFHDMLTGLPNRTLFSDRLSMAIGHAQRTREMIGVMMLDVDRFKDINDVYGHDFGDLVLKEIADRLRNIVRRTDTIARMGGDEFMGIFTDIRKMEDLETIGKKILNGFVSPIFVKDKSFKLTVSMGFSLYPLHGNDLDSLLRRADYAMYEVKQGGRNGFKIFGTENRSVP